MNNRECVSELIGMVGAIKEIRESQEYIDTVKFAIANLEKTEAGKSSACDGYTALRKVAEETLEEIEYWHSDMLTIEERNHPRGSGWARVYDKLKEALAV